MFYDRFAGQTSTAKLQGSCVRPIVCFVACMWPAGQVHETRLQCSPPKKGAAVQHDTCMCFVYGGIHRACSAGLARRCVLCERFAVQTNKAKLSGFTHRCKLKSFRTATPPIFVPPFLGGKWYPFLEPPPFSVCGLERC